MGGRNCRRPCHLLWALPAPGTQAHTPPAAQRPRLAWTLLSLYARPVPPAPLRSTECTNGDIPTSTPKPRLEMLVWLMDKTWEPRGTAVSQHAALDTLNSPQMPQPIRDSDAGRWQGQNLDPQRPQPPHTGEWDRGLQPAAVNTRAWLWSFPKNSPQGKVRGSFSPKGCRLQASPRVLRTGDCSRQGLSPGQEALTLRVERPLLAGQLHAGRAHGLTGTLILEVASLQSTKPAGGQEVLSQGCPHPGPTCISVPKPGLFK